MAEETRNLRKVRQGVVVSDANDKTIVVQIRERKPHPIYKKMMTSTKKFHAHDENNEAHVGDTVRIMETRPLSKMKRGGKVWITIFPDKPITKKPAETRMGSGKGNPEGWVAVVKPGRIMFEIAGVDDETAKEALRLAVNKLPIKCKIVNRESEGQQ